MGRISRQVMFMDMARAASKRATCHRLNVGAIVVHANNPISIGYNGAPSGYPHCAGNECAGIVPGNCGTLHAERNALEKAKALLIEPSNPPAIDLYCTHSPCESCMRYMLDGWLYVRRLFFEIPYRNTDHLRLLTSSKGQLDRERVTEVYEVSAAGYIIDYFSRKVVELP